jgi:hypothetical protein
MPDKETKVTKIVTNENPLFDFTLSELREMYPTIKSTSVKGFIAKIEANEQG